MAKLGILRVYPTFLRAFLAEVRDADVVHVRCPAHVSLLAVVTLAFLKKPAVRWIKYAGNWHPDGPEPWTYRFQRWWLSRGWHRGVVTVNGSWDDQPRHVISFLNPCLTKAELSEARELASRKTLTQPVRLLYVGRVEEEKGVGRAIDVIAGLRRFSLEATLDIVGGGPDQSGFEARARRLRVDNIVRFLGWLSRSGLDALYGPCHFLLLPSTSSEGWPKVLSEAMAFGVVPLAGRVSSIPQLLGSFDVGKAIDPHDVRSYVEAIIEYSRDPATWKEESNRAAQAAGLFTYDEYLKAVRKILELSER